MQIYETTQANMPGDGQVIGGVLQSNDSARVDQDIVDIQTNP